MKTLAFLSQKGGSGKTTLAVHTAAAAEEDSERVALIDTDPQRSACAWGEVREADTPVVAAAPAASLRTALDAAERKGMTLCIVDTAPHTAPDAAAVAAIADLLLIPVRPTALDLAAVSGTASMVKGLHAVFVLSACPFRAPEIEQAREVLSRYGLPVFEGEITDRRAFARAVASGSAVTEFDPEGKAAGEIRGLWKFIKEQTQ